MFKNLIIALFFAVFLILGIGTLVTDFLDVHIQLDSYAKFEPFASLALVAGLTVVSVILVFILASSILGLVLLAMGSIFVGLFITGLSLTWPIIAILVLALLVSRERNINSH